MVCSITNSILIVTPIWKPFTKKPNFNPYVYHIKAFEELSTNVRVLSEIYPPYGSGWIRIELEIEAYFQNKLDTWNKEVACGRELLFKDVINEIKMHRQYLKKTYNILLNNNVRIKSLLKQKLMQYIEFENYMDSLKILNTPV